MTSQDAFLKKLIMVLGDCSIPYMISGSFVSSYHGRPRATKDIDFVIAPAEKQLLGQAARLVNKSDTSS